MLISYNWLLEYLPDLKKTPFDDFIKKMTLVGFEVENIEKLTQISPLVIARIVKIEKHPNADSLAICQVDLKDRTVQIVTAAKNIYPNMITVLALPGAKIGEQIIKESSLRGVLSQGMFCSKIELGVSREKLSSQESEGIIELDPSFEVGATNVYYLMGLDDIVIDFALLPSRVDCYSFFNFIKEISYIFSIENHLPQIEDIHHSLSDFYIGSETPLCPLFNARIYKNIKYDPLCHKKIKRYLRMVSIKSISYLVDLGNYLMYLFGQPVHMYDLDKLAKNELIVRDDIEASFVALDDKIYQVKTGDLVITSNERIVCLAGIYGAKEVEIDDQTINVVIEAALFDSKTIRQTATRLNLLSDSAMHFIRGTVYGQGQELLDYADALLNSKQVADIKPYSLTKINRERNITTTLMYHNRRLGLHLNEAELLNLLNQTGLFAKSNDHKIIVTIPYHRKDLEIEADLSEEIIRHLGFDVLENTLPSVQNYLGFGLNQEQGQIREIKTSLLSKGLNEVITYSLISKEDFDTFNTLDKEYQPQILMNPLTSARQYVRKDLIASLLRTLEYNFNRGTTSLGIFELSNTYAINYDDYRLGIALLNNLQTNDSFKEVPYTFYHLKDHLETILITLGIDPVRLNFTKLNDKLEEYHPNIAYQILIDNRLIGHLAKIHPQALKTFNLEKESVFAAEISLKKLLSLKTSQTKSTPISVFQPVTLDFSFITTKDLNLSKLFADLKRIDSQIKEIKTFDMYQNSSMNFPSLSIRVSIEPSQKTLTNEEKTHLKNQIIAVIETKHHQIVPK